MILHKIKILIFFSAYGSQWPIFKATSAKSTKLDGQQRPPWSRIRRLYRWRDKSPDRTHLQWWKVSCCTNSDGIGPEISKTWKSWVITKKIKYYSSSLINTTVFFKNNVVLIHLSSLVNNHKNHWIFMD